MKDFFSEINRMLDRFLTPAVKVILVVNVLVTVALIILMAISPRGVGWLIFIFGQMPALSVKKFYIWQFLTFNFIHRDFMHLLLNMLMLWFFAPPLENRWGTRKFWQFYLVTGIGAGLFHAVISLAGGPGDQLIIGASGAIYGVMLAFAAYFPDQPIYLMGVYPIKAKYLMIILILFEFMSSAQASGSNISHLTHLTGLGVAYCWLARRHRDWDIRRWRWTRV